MTTHEDVMKKLEQLEAKLNEIAAVVGISNASHPYQRILDKEQPKGTIDVPIVLEEGKKPSDVPEEVEPVNLNSMGAPAVPVDGKMVETAPAGEEPAELPPSATPSVSTSTTTKPTTTTTTTTKTPSTSS